MSGISFLGDSRVSQATYPTYKLPSLCACTHSQWCDPSSARDASTYIIMVTESEKRRRPCGRLTPVGAKLLTEVCGLLPHWVIDGRACGVFLIARAL